MFEPRLFKILSQRKKDILGLFLQLVVVALVVLPIFALIVAVLLPELGQVFRQISDNYITFYFYTCFDYFFNNHFIASFAPGNFFVSPVLQEIYGAVSLVVSIFFVMYVLFSLYAGLTDVFLHWHREKNPRLLLFSYFLSLQPFLFALFYYGGIVSLAVLCLVPALLFMNNQVVAYSLFCVTFLILILSVTFMRSRLSLTWFFMIEKKVSAFQAACLSYRFITKLYKEKLSAEQANKTVFSTAFPLFYRSYLSGLDAVFFSDLYHIINVSALGTSCLFLSSNPVYFLVCFVFFIFSLKSIGYGTRLYLNFIEKFEQ